MNRLTLLPIIALLLFSSLLISCETPAPSPGSVKVDIGRLQSREISLADLQAAYSDDALTPPLYEQPAGTRLHAIVIPFDIMSLPSDVSFNRVAVIVNLVKDVGTSSFPPNEDVHVVTAIPDSIDRTADVERSQTIAAAFSAAISSLGGEVSVEGSRSERYQKLYRTVSAHYTRGDEVVWEFVPFQDEPLLPGTYHVVAVVEVREGTTGNMAYVSGGCSFSASGALGLSEEVDACSMGTSERLTFGQ